MDKKVFLNCNMFDGHAESVLVKCAVYVEKGVITKITENQNPSEGFEVIDLEGKYLMPGLVNPHIHLFGTGKPSKAISGGKTQERLMKLIKTSIGGKILDILVKDAARQELLSGVTTARTAGDFHYSDVRLRDKIKSGLALGPRLVVSGPAITVSGGHGDGTFALTADDNEGLKALVRKNKEAGVDYIKICVTGGVIDAKVKGEPGELRMNLEQTKAVCEEAHRLGLRVASHTESIKGVEITAAAGVDTVEHGAALDEKTAAQMKASNSAMVVTYSPALPLMLLSPELTMLDPICVYNTEIVVNNMTQGAKDCIENGILLGIGTDASCPFATQYNMWREIVYLKKCVGVGNAYALSVATLGNAKVAGVDKLTGSIEEGKAADMIITEENPLENLHTLSRLHMVVYGGEVIYYPSPKKNAFIDTKLDEMMITL